MSHTTKLRARGLGVRVALVVATLLFAVLPVGTAIAFAAMYLRTGAIVFPYPDFFAFWSFGAFALSHPPAALFDDAALFDFQHATGLEAVSHYPFLYPPPILLALMPLGMLPYGVARVVFTALGMIAYALALAPWRWRWPLPITLLVAPTTFGCALIGQNGFWSAALMFGGLRLLGRRDITAGVLFGVLAYKPQLAFLAPVALLAGGHVRALAAAAATVIAMVALSVLVAGLDVWGAWLASMTAHGHALASGRATLDIKMPTVTAAVKILGGGAMLANIAQVAAAAIGAAAVWRAGGRTGARARAVLPVATLLATPHAFYYDLTLLTGAVLAVIADRMARDASFALAEFALLLAAIVAPIFVVHTGGGAAFVTVLLLPLLVLLSWPETVPATPWPRSRRSVPALSDAR